MTTIARYAADTSVGLIAKTLEQDGAVIIEGLLDETTVARLNREVDPLLAEADPAMQHLNSSVAAFFGTRVRHLAGLAGKSMTFAEEVMCHPLYLALCDHFLLPNCADYQLNLGHLMERGPGAQAQMLHRDEAVWVHYQRPRPELQLATVVALVDFTRENGATIIAPGSHRWPEEREATDADLVCAEMPAGSAVIYLGSTMHAGGANTTRDQWRRGFHMSYALGWLRTEENNVLAVPPVKARELSTRAQRLLGYGVHDAIKQRGGYLGMVDMRDTLELLNEGRL
ncbi:phytanoyl-CoA dioxygenase family protein [Cupriavidus basilensis]|uniref:phytanoyl-CoA dioxygenase family protein n=1 Tax=Cupriavidus sp. TaxID=1873897 RepID=UPI00044E0DF2